ncbi:hypothetical protein [Aureibacter tunicatorum]|uniref:Uncharacterized protein n=1 Tax=Aureibacter tunicatorum TaxID=866807 RepID=A0AAE3XJT2_9BACT|nr:hypothetical protein [Aureibacter tunicatorum]MDR6238187.1 hypothetical protein [Aureibacter tunicatorum]BDD03220.1 hypothetical protein AUTU_07030 [Aureibacter tunicatorum]
MSLKSLNTVQKLTLFSFLCILFFKLGVFAGTHIFEGFTLDEVRKFVRFVTGVVYAVGALGIYLFQDKKKLSDESRS